MSGTVAVEVATAERFLEGIPAVPERTLAHGLLVRLA
jgi:hypothetical protein